MLNEFIEYLNSNVDVSIYVFGAQGTGYHTKPQLTDEWILKHDNTKRNAEIAIDLFHKRIKEGKRKKVCAFDCSGLGMYWLYNTKGIFKSDLTANGMKGKCKPIERAELKRGDWVFRVKDGKAYHIGYVVDNNRNVVEAKSHRDGVVKRALNASGSAYWNYYGRPFCFEDEIEKEDEKEVKYIKKRAKSKIKPIYNENGVIEKGRYIAKNDVCSIKNIMTDNCLIQVEYPTKAGSHIGFIKELSAF